VDSSQETVSRAFILDARISPEFPAAALTLVTAARNLSCDVEVAAHATTVESAKYCSLY